MPSSTLVEGRVVEKIISLLKNDSAVTSFVAAADIMDSHPAEAPGTTLTFPRITLFLLTSDADMTPGIVTMNIQVDLWFSSENNTKMNLYDCYKAVRDVLHRHNGLDSTIGVRIGQMIETPSGAVQEERETRLWHLAKVYQVKAMLQ